MARILQVDLPEQLLLMTYQQHGQLGWCVPMNTDQVSGNWTELVGRAKRAWGELTDDDILKAEGSLDKLAGIIQAKWGDTKEAVTKKLSHMQRNSRRP